MASARTLTRWHAEFNREVFEGKLGKLVIAYSAAEIDGLPQDQIVLEKRTDIPGNIVVGVCYGDRIVIRPGLNRDLTRASLLHEMVHQWQFENGHPMDHGPTFRDWREIIAAERGIAV